MPSTAPVTGSMRTSVEELWLTTHRSLPVEASPTGPAHGAEGERLIVRSTSPVSASSCRTTSFMKLATHRKGGAYVPNPTGYGGVTTLVIVFVAGSTRVITPLGPPRSHSPVC